MVAIGRPSPAIGGAPYVVRERAETAAQPQLSYKLSARDHRTILHIYDDYARCLISVFACLLCTHNPHLNLIVSILQ